MNKFKRMLRNGSLVIAMLGASAANAALIDFESVDLGVYDSLVFGDATLTFTGGTGNFTIDTGYNNTKTAISFFENPGESPFRLDFAGGATSVSIDVGDFGSDQDLVFLGLYDAMDNLLASTNGIVPAGSADGITISTSTTNAAYALFSDAEPFAGAVYWDNINWEPANSVEVPVPVSGTSALFALSFAAFAWSKRKKA